MRSILGKGPLLAIVVSVFFSAALGQMKPKTSGNDTSVIKVDDVSVQEILKPDGKPLLVNFWATWCVPCVEEFPLLVELHKKYKGKIDLITISLDDLAEINRDVPKFLKEQNAKMPAYLLYTKDENKVISSISKDLSGGLPLTVFYDEAGKLLYTRQGLIKKEIITPLIDSTISFKECEPGELDN